MLILFAAVARYATIGNRANFVYTNQFAFRHASYQVISAKKALVTCFKFTTKLCNDNFLVSVQVLQLSIWQFTKLHYYNMTQPCQQISRKLRVYFVYLIETTTIPTTFKV